MSAKLLLSDHPIHTKYLSGADLHILSKTCYMDEMVDVVTWMLARMPGDLHAISGPVSTGSPELTPEQRALLFAACIEERADEGYPMFSPIAFQGAMERYAEAYRRIKGADAYPWPIMTEFYEAVFRSGKFHQFHVMPNFRSSKGSTYEVERAHLWGMLRMPLSSEFINRVRAKHGMPPMQLSNVPRPVARSYMPSPPLGV